MLNIKNLLAEARAIADDVVSISNSIKSAITIDNYETNGKIDNFNIFGTPYKIEYSLKVIDPHFNARGFKHGASVDTRRRIIHVDKVNSPLPKGRGEFTLNISILDIQTVLVEKVR